MDFLAVLNEIDNFIWGPPLLVLLVGTGYPAYNPAESFADIQIAEGAEPDFQGAKCGQR